jgi:hypothetical protein
MATRQQRLDAFVHEGDPPAEEPFDLLCGDHVGTFAIPFLVDGLATIGKYGNGRARSSHGDWAGDGGGKRVKSKL